MDSGIVRTALTNTLPLEHDCREPREVGPEARARSGTQTGKNTSRAFRPWLQMSSNDCS